MRPSVPLGTEDVGDAGVTRHRVSSLGARTLFGQESAGMGTWDWIQVALGVVAVVVLAVAWRLRK